MKKALSLLLVLLLCVTSVPMAFASSTGITSFQVNPYGGAQDAIDTVNWYASGGIYFLFLPADADLEHATVFFTASDDVSFDGTPLVSGAQTAVFAAIGDHTLQCADNTYTLRVIQSENLPAVYIDTESGSLDYLHASKENKEKGNIRIYENGEMTLDSALKQIKGRGNATWNYAKKPYNIKFDKKTDLFGMGKAKKWTLLASHVMDNSLMKNPTALDLGRAIGLSNTSNYQHVDMFINGEYLGTYIICESVEIGSTRVNITDLEGATEDANPGVDLEAGALLGQRSGYVPGSKKWVDIEQNPDNITGGYLLEFDYLYRYHDEASGFISNIGQPIVIGSPEYATKAQVDYISAYWQKAEDALYADSGYNSEGSYYLDYFDLDSLVKCYLIEELTKDVDSGITSFYFYKDADDKIHAGPLWDFDHALGSGTTISGGLTVWEPNTWYANQLRRNSIDTSCNGYPTFFAKCYAKADFRAAVKAAWPTFAGTLLQEKLDAMPAQRDLLTASAVMNHLRWNPYGTLDAEQVNTRYQSDANALISFLQQRKTALNTGFDANGAVVYYDANGGAGTNVYDSAIHTVGETATGKACTYTKNGMDFVGWNTKADGSGQWVNAGAAFTVAGDYTLLYAQWQPKQPPTEPTNPPTEPDNPPTDSSGSFDQSLRDFWQKIVDFFRRVADFWRNLFHIN